MSLSMKNYYADRAARVGTFVVRHELIEKHPAVVAEFFARMRAVVLDTEYMHAWRGTRYRVLSPALHWVDEGRAVVNYLLETTQDAEEVEPGVFVCPWRLTCSSTPNVEMTARDVYEIMQHEWGGDS